uniref:Membrane protein, palmitoylated 4a (MAGUK p55 subfamily member 4) n=1 Tax=Amphiprion ocellaris TaxID=80972 RepID=A0AAQ5ZQW0_AMPOC
MRQAMDDGVTEVLSSVVDDVGQAVERNINGAQLLYELLSAPWLRALLKIYECLLQFQRLSPSPFLPYASGLSHEIMTVIQKTHRPSPEARELYSLLSSPHIHALLSTHDSVAQWDYEPVLPPLPDDLPDDEEAMRIVCLVKNNQPLRGEDHGGSVGDGLGLVRSRWNSLRRLTLERLVPARRAWSGEELRVDESDARLLPREGQPHPFLPRYQSTGSCCLCPQAAEHQKKRLNQSAPSVFSPAASMERPKLNREEGASIGGSSDDYAYPPPPVPAYSFSLPNSPILYKKCTTGGQSRNIPTPGRTPSCPGTRPPRVRTAPSSPATQRSTRQQGGATIRRNEETGEIYIARVIHGGLADRSGLLHSGDLLVEVNGNPVGGLEPEEVIQILTNSHGTILFKVIPNPGQISSNQKPVYMKAMVDYCPLQDACIPCPDAGMAFSRGDLLEVVDQSDAHWWQARKLPCAASCAGLIPSASMLKSKQKEQWWRQPLQVHTCIRPLSMTDNEDDPQHGDDKRNVTALEEINFDEADSDITEGIYLAGFRRSFRLWRRTSYRKRRQSCTTCSPNSNALNTPYEEVALYQRPPQENHRLIILVGAPGVGVNELRKRLIKLNPSTFQSPVPHTTRPIRPEEQSGREYHFVTKELFEYLVCNHRFVEYGESKGQLYGTSTDAIDEVLKRGRMCIIDIEPHSIQFLRTKKLKPFVIFVKAPSPERLRQTRRDARIITNFTINRAFTEDDFVELEEASQLMEAKYRQFFDSVLVNDDLQDACIQLCSIIQQAQNEPQWIPVSWGRTE